MGLDPDGIDVSLHIPVHIPVLAYRFSPLYLEVLRTAANYQKRVGREGRSAHPVALQPRDNFEQKVADR